MHFKLYIISDFLIDFTGPRNGDIENLSKKNKPTKLKLPGTGKVKTNSKICSKDIQQSLKLRFTNHKYVISNAYIFPGWESDFFSVSDSGYLYEIEIKVSKSDFKDDFNKKNKHILLESSKSDNDFVRPNKFFYAVPRGLLPSYSIPVYAGLIEVSNKNEQAVVIKEAPFIHKEKLLDNYKTKLLDKFCWRYNDLLLRHFEDQDIEFNDKDI